MYQHVYETVEVQGSPEARATATAKVSHVYQIEQLQEFTFTNIMESECTHVIRYWPLYNV